MRKISIRLLAAILMLLMVLPMLFACGETPEESKRPEETQAPSESESESETEGGEVENTQKPLELIKDGKSEFTIVINRYAQFINDKAAYMIKDAVKEISGAEIAVGKDYELFLASLDMRTYANYLMQVEYEASGGKPGFFADIDAIVAAYNSSSYYEILIGDTDRAESARAIADLKEENEYILRLDGNKIVLVASSNKALIAGAEALISEYLSNETTDLTIESLNKSAVIEVEVDEDPKVFYGMTQSEVDEAFGELLDGLFTGKTTEVIIDEHVGYDIEFNCPDILYEDGKYYAYYNRRVYKTHADGSNWLDEEMWAKDGWPGLAFITSVAVSDDGRRWTYLKDAATFWEDDGDPTTDDYMPSLAAFPGVWKDEDGIMYLVYEASGGENVPGYVQLQVSFDNGETWIKEGAILTKSQFPAWCNLNIGTPDLYYKDGIWCLTFHGFGAAMSGNNGGCQRGVAYGDNLRKLTPHQTPILPTEEDTLWSGTTGECDVFFCDGYYYMVYEVSTVGTQGYGNALWSHMFARSRDMINWEHTEAPLLSKAPDDEGGVGLWNDQTCWIVIDGKLYVISNDDYCHSTHLVELLPIQ